MPKRPIEDKTNVTPPAAKRKKRNNGRALDIQTQEVTIKRSTPIILEEQVPLAYFIPAFYGVELQDIPPIFLLMTIPGMEYYNEKEYSNGSTKFSQPLSPQGIGFFQCAATLSEIHRCSDEQGIELASRMYSSGFASAVTQSRSFGEEKEQQR